jgi:citrate lyase subunit beta/citryl-CoA lyase
MTASMMFVPANTPERFAKAQGTAAGALILDLEDSVAPPDKDQARRNVVELMASAKRHQQLWVRVNSMSSGLMLKDLAAVIPTRPFGVMIPKCSGKETIEPLCHYLDALETACGTPVGETKILAIATETSRSLFRLHEYDAAGGRLWGLTWGNEDLAADVGTLSNREGDRYSEPYRLARSMCLFAAAAAGVRALDGVFIALNDTEGLIREAKEAQRDGFIGKIAIHPSQIDPINQAFSYSEQQVQWARRVIDAFEKNPGQRAIRLDNRMLDEPHLKLARRMVGAAE